MKKRSQGSLFFMPFAKSTVSDMVQANDYASLPF